MLDLIYIVEEHLAPRSDATTGPNFTMPGRDGISTISGASASSAALAALGGMNLLATLPTALISSAFIATPALVALVGKAVTDKNATDAAEQQKAGLLADYVQKHSKSPSQAREEGYRFQPGHPVIGKTYRKHPLTDYPNPESGRLYIPSDSYDSILLEERESELIKLLVHLGATRITITKKSSDKTVEAVHAGASVQAGPGGGGINYQGHAEQTSNSMDTREFLLAGRKWRDDSQLDRTNFFWLAYEPSWKAVVFAREYGGCLSASLEIKESTSFSSDKSVELSVKAKLAEVSAQAGMKNTGTEEKTYYVKAEFAPIEQEA